MQLGEKEYTSTSRFRYTLFEDRNEIRLHTESLKSLLYLDCDL
jgi:hypothetical protein